MLITLSGKVTHKLEESVVIEAGGLGYNVWLSNTDYDKVSAGSEAQLWVYDHIKEDARELYGFTELSQRDLFIKLLGISGVGPKAALAIFSVGSFSNLHQAIAEGDVALLQSAQGVGKRTAERIVMELKSSIGPVLESTGAQASSSEGAVEALESLGYSRSDAVAALAQTDQDAEEEERIKQALRSMS